MLRIALLVLGGLLLVAAAAMVAGGHAANGWPVLAVWGLLLVVGVVFEKRRYKCPLSEPPGPGWEPTSEKFIDPASGAAVVVYFKAATGERVYVLDPEKAP